MAPEDGGWGNDALPYEAKHAEKELVYGVPQEEWDAKVAAQMLATSGDKYDNAVQVSGLPYTHWYILNKLLDEWADYFTEKGLDYREGANELGIKGQFADINRKFLKLRAAMWEERVLQGEPLREVLQDMIGHCFLSIAMLDHTAVDPR